MSNAEPLLVIESEKDEFGCYIVRYRGAEWGLISPITEIYTGFNYRPHYDTYRYGFEEMGIQFEMRPVPPRPEPEPKPLPKKSWARSMGLRKPK